MKKKTKWKEVFRGEGWSLPRTCYGFRGIYPIPVACWNWNGKFLHLSNIWRYKTDICFRKKKEQYRKVRIIVLELEE
jgi:hypothetical protein